MPVIEVVAPRVVVLLVVLQEVVAEDHAVEERFVASPLPLDLAATGDCRS